MSRLRMTKGEFALRKRQLLGFEHALPSLELKRQQIVQDLTVAHADLLNLRQDVERLLGEAGAIAFAADHAVVIEPLLMLTGVSRRTQTRLGIELPEMERIVWADIDLPDRYPPWVAAAVATMRALAETRLRVEVAEMRAAQLDGALRKTIQRINLLQQVLIPEARRDIARIGTFLADVQRMAIARTKLSVARRRREAISGQGVGT